MSDEYTLERLQMALAPRQIRYLPSIASTNDEATRWLTDGAPSGSVVIADEQTAGRGRHGRTWHTPPGVAIALSVILHPSQQHMAGVNMAGTLAVFRTLSTLNMDNVRIKWANDVLVDGKKISGVLPEAVWDGDQLQGTVLGIGVNVRNTFEGTPISRA
jgi:BirA family biotin operon repressor/biotin-[acetyl-CoA-carboxylase] ligase